MSFVRRSIRLFYEAPAVPPSGAPPAEAYSPYPWWQPFFTWPRAEQIDLPLDLLDLPRRHVATTTPMPIVIMGGASYRFVPGPRPIVRPIIASTLLQQARLIEPRPADPVMPPRRILTEVAALVDRQYEQRLREDDELLLLLPAPEQYA